MKELTAVQRSVLKATEAIIRRDAAIREAYAAGVPLRTIAQAAGLSHGRIHQIVRNV